MFLAPNVNSYKRYAAGSWAPTTLAWGNDNRTCGFRVVGHGASRRVETRIPGGDVNPYLAFAAIIAAGLHGIEQGLEPPAALEGNAYESDAERFPHALREAIAALENGTMARAAFGDQVVDHYLNYARTEQALFDRFVTDWERKRLFERLNALQHRLQGVVTERPVRSGITPYGSRRTSSRRAGASGTCRPPSSAARLRRWSSAAGGRRSARAAERGRGVEETLDALDGIVFSGGSDLDPRRTAPSRTRRRTPHERRDRGELALLRAALERDLPVLAVCRGSSC